MPHLIRLREPWEREPLDEGAVRYRRRFHRPTGLDESSRVWLVIDAVGSPATVTLNDRLLGDVAGYRARFDITAELLPQNLLAMVLPPPAVLGPVRLEIG
jgi:hypothetical protein